MPVILHEHDCHYIHGHEKNIRPFVVVIVVIVFGDCNVGSSRTQIDAKTGRPHPPVHQGFRYSRGFAISVVSKVQG